jgi:ABC-2 type transport system permease protein
VNDAERAYASERANRPSHEPQPRRPLRVTIVTPPSEAASPELRPVGGPSAFGGDRRRFWNLLWLMSVTEFKTHYIGSALGYAWTLIRPLLFFGIVFMVIREVIRFGEGIENYAAMLMLNIILFQYFQEATSRSVRSVTQRENLVRKMQFPRIVIPLSVSLTAGFTLLLNLVAGFALILVFGVDPTATWLLFPLLLVPLVALTTAIAAILSVLFVRYEDIQQVWSVLSRMLFYATPILYPIELVPESFRAILALNPLTPLFVQAREWVIDPSAPSVIDAFASPVLLAVPLVLLVGLCIFGLWIFEREAPRVAEAL